MKFRDSFTLARTKQKTRRMRRLFVGGVCAILFAVLLTGSFLASGISKSAQQLRSYGYNKQYLATATANFQNANLQDVRTASQTEMDKELRARKITVTDAVRQSESYQAELSRRASVRMRTESNAQRDTFIAQARRDYKPLAVYPYEVVETMTNAEGLTPTDRDPFLTRQRDQLVKRQQRSGSADSWRPPAVQRVDQAMLASALQPGQTFDWQPGQPYPIVIPYASLPQMAGKSLASMPAAAQQAEYKTLIKRYTGTTLEYCYRNPAAQSQLTATLQYNLSAESDKDSKTKPLQLADCQPLDQKALQKAGIIANPSDPTSAKPFFTHPEDVPVTQIVTFKIVGFIPTASYGENQSKIASLISGVNNWGSHVNPGIMPQQVYERAPFLSSDASNVAIGAGNETTVFFDFADRAAQQRFIDASCEGMHCMKANAWHIENFGNVVVSSEKIVRTVGIILLWAAMSIGVIAALLMMSTISKLVADSRKEIAVFQALGARTRDIVQIYISYGLLLAAGTLTGALIISLTVALSISQKYSDSVGVHFAVAVGVFDQSLTVSLFGIQISWLLVIIGVLVAATVAGVLLALLFRGRRNVIEHMKDE